MRVLVTGATGRLGSVVVKQLETRGHDPVALSRHAGPGLVAGDLSTGVGLPSAIEGADAIVHAASDPQGDPQSTDVVGTKRLAQAGIPLLYVSIVGVDQHPLKYYTVKREGEVLLEKSGTPFTILRATQFHAFVADLIAKSKKSVGGRIPFLNSDSQPILMPNGFKFQSVDHYEVASRIVDLVEAGPTGKIEQFAGPEVLDAVDMAKQWAELNGGHVIGVPTLGASASGFKKGLNTARAGTPAGTVTWTDYLRGDFGSAHAMT